MSDSVSKGVEASNTDEVRERLNRLMDFLVTQSAFTGDNLSWAAICIKSYLDGSKKTLDHAFGLRDSKRGPKQMMEGTHDDWVVSAWCEVIGKAPLGKDFPNTATLAKIGRYYGLGGQDSANTEDHAIASELKRILKRYQPIIVKQLSDRISAGLDEADG